MLDSSSLPEVQDSLQACDPSESALTPAPQYLDAVYGDSTFSRAPSRAATPMIVRSPPRSFKSPSTPHTLRPQSKIPCTFPESATSSPKSIRLVSHADELRLWKER